MLPAPAVVDGGNINHRRALSLPPSRERVGAIPHLFGTARVSTTCPVAGLFVPSIAVLAASRICWSTRILQGADRLDLRTKRLSGRYSESLYGGCMDMEQTVYDRLKGIWNNVPQSTRAIAKKLAQWLRVALPLAPPPGLA